MNTRHKDAASAAAALTGNPAVGDQVRNEIKYSAVVAALLNMRVSRGLSQDQIAKSMKCDPSKVSRIEGGNDRNLKWMDIVGYVKAMNLNMCLTFEDPSLPAAERIKSRVFKIHSDLEELTTLAKKVGSDDKIAKKIHQFYGEVLLNFVVHYKDNFDQLCSVIKFEAPAIQERNRLPSPEQDFSSEPETTAGAV